jgi:hypothetical protein
MPRWIVFDQDTASELRSRLPQASVFEAPGRAALEYALNSPRSVVAVLPPSLGNGSAVAVFRPGRAGSRPATTTPRRDEGGIRTESAPPVKPSRVRAGGFLGLNDEVVVEEETPHKKNWWQRFTD